MSQLEKTAANAQQILPADDAGRWDIKPSPSFSIIFIKECATGK